MDIVKIGLARQLLVKISNTEFQGRLPTDLGADTVSDGRTTRLNLHIKQSDMYNEYETFLRNDKKPSRTAPD
jgi:hypothetical protein